MSMNLSSLLKVGVSTYENWSMDTVVEQMENDLNELKDDDWKIMVQGVWMVEIKEIDCDDNLDFDAFKVSVGKSMQECLEWVCDLKEIFAKYGLEYTGISFFTPQYYNYENDGLDIHLKTMREEYDLVSLWLKDLILEYIENVRQESYDWYCSFEPTDFDKVGIDDYCTLWAILKKEGVYDDLKEALQDWVDEWFSEFVRKHSNPTYTVKVPNGVKYDRKEFTLDYDNKVLIPIE